MPGLKRKLTLAVLLVPMAAALLLPAGCGKKAVTQEEALESIGAAYRMMAESTGYRYHSEVKYEFPDMDEEQRAGIASMIPSYLELEGEVRQEGGNYSQHSVTTGMGDPTESYIINGLSYQNTASGGWVVMDLASYKLNLSNMYFLSSEDFENMLGFVGEVKVIEDSPERLVLSFNAGGDYLLSSLEKNKDRYQTEEQLAVYNNLLQIMQGSTTEITSYVYRDSGYLQRQETTMSLPNTPMLGTVVMTFSSEFFDYGADIQIVLPEEAAKAKAK